jgi:hypothetical protein
MKRLMNKITDMLADATLLEMGVNVVTPVSKAGMVRETLEENLIEIAFAEAADYDDIHKAILREHQSERDIAHPDECHYGDNDMCFV